MAPRAARKFATAAVTAAVSPGRLDAVAARRRLGRRGPGPDGRGQGRDVQPGGAPKVTDVRRRHRRAAVQPLRGALEHDPAGREDHDAVRHLLGLAQLVGGDDDAHAALLQPGHHGAHGHAPLGVDAGGRLVEEGHLGPADQGQGEREPLLFAAREVAPRRGGDAAQPDEVEQLVGGTGSA